MKILTRCLSGIVPIFAVLSVAVAAVRYWAGYSNVRWGLEEDARSLAVTIAQFAPENLFRSGSNVSSDGNAISVSDFRSSVEKIMLTRSSRRIFAVSVSGRDIVFDSGRDSGSALPEICGETAGILDRGDSVTRLIETGSRGSSAAMLCLAPVIGRDSRPAGIVGVEKDAGILAVQKSEGIAGARIAFCSGTLAGIVCAWIVAFVLSRQLKLLTASANRVMGGEFNRDTEENRGFIQEVRDLWNIFDTLVSVLKGVGVRAKRDLIEMRRFRTRSTLAMAFSMRLACSREWKGEQGSAFIGNPAHPGPGHFTVLAEDGGSIVMCFGSVVETNDDLLTARHASAASSFLSRSLRRRCSVETAEETVGFFEMESFCGMSWALDSRELELFRHDRESKGFVKESRKLNQGKAEIVHNLDDETGEKMGLYAESFRFENASRLGNELLGIAGTLRPGCSGFVACVLPVGE